MRGGAGYARESLSPSAALSRHMKVCEKVFMKKRKPMEIQRIPDEQLAEAKQLAKQAARKVSSKVRQVWRPTNITF